MYLKKKERFFWKKGNIIKLKLEKKNNKKSFQIYIKMNEKFIASGDTETGKNKCHCHKH